LDPALQDDGGERLLAEQPGLPIAVLVGRDAPGSAAAAMHRAAFDYLTWPIDPHRLRVILAHAFERHRLLERIRRLEVLAAPAGFDEVDGTLRAIDRMEKRAILDALRRADGNVRQAARLLGLGQATVYRKVKRYKIPLGRGRSPASEDGLTPRPTDAARFVG
jgi:DNA-binding NtrC family response regulator